MAVRCIKSKLGAAVHVYQFLHGRPQALKIYYFYSIYLSQVHLTYHAFPHSPLLPPIHLRRPIPNNHMYPGTHQHNHHYRRLINPHPHHRYTNAIANSQPPSPPRRRTPPAPPPSIHLSPTNKPRSTSAPSQTSPAPACTFSSPPPPRPRHASNSTAQRRPSGRIRGLIVPSSRTPLLQEEVSRR